MAEELVVPQDDLGPMLVGFTTEPLPRDATIYERMVRILAELPAIGKDSYNQQQSFHYRSHDDVLNALNPLLAQHGVFIAPTVIKRVPGERVTGNNKTMYEVNLCVRFYFYGLAGDHIEVVTWGEGTDMGDKATNKAMTGAFKSALAQAFAVSTEESYDADGGTPEHTTRGSGAAPAAEARPGGHRTAPAAQRASGSPPATALMQDAIRGEGAQARIRESLQQIEPTVDWMGTIGPRMYDLYGTTVVGDLTPEQYTEFWMRLANAEAACRAEIAAAGGGDFPPLEEERILRALSWAFSGTVERIELRTNGEEAHDGDVQADPPGEVAE